MVLLEWVFIRIGLKMDVPLALLLEVHLALLRWLALLLRLALLLWLLRWTTRSLLLLRLGTPLLCHLLLLGSTGSLLRRTLELLRLASLLDELRERLRRLGHVGES